MLAASLVIAAVSPAQARWWFYPAPIMVPETRPPLKQRGIDAKRRLIPGVKATAPEKLPPGPLHIVISIKQQRMTLYRTVSRSRRRRSRPACPATRRRKACSA